MALLEPVNASWCLEQICDSNYQKLLQLIPELTLYDQLAIGDTRSAQPPLVLKILERNPYTITIELSHQFRQGDGLLLPALKVRLYLDACLAEVLSDNDRPAVKQLYPDPGNFIGIRQYKWRLNYFLQKWLDFCMQAQYTFKSVPLPQGASD